MGVASSLMRFLDRFSPPEKVSAHCDIPCGVYETDSMKWAVETIDKLTRKILDIKGMDAVDRSLFVRSVEIREKYAQVCKNEILILWTDYFKPEHLQKHPKLHELVWSATKQCSTVRRTMNLEEVEKLRGMVAEISQIFAETKKAAK